MLELQIAIAKTNKYASRESGDTVEIVERPLGGFAAVMCDGQGSGGAAKILSNMVVGQAIGLLKDGARLEMVAPLVHDYLYAYRGGKVTASLVILAADLQSGEIGISRSSDCPVLLLNRDGVTLLDDEAAAGLGINRTVKPQFVSLPLEAGMYVVAYTDGVMHAGEKYDHMVSVPPIIATAAQQPGADAQSVAEHLLQVAIGRDRHRPADDMSVVALHMAEVEDTKGPLVRRIIGRVPFEQ